MQYSKNLLFRKGFFYFLTLFLIAIFYFSFDLILSNTLLKSKFCYKYITNEKGYFYYLKKNCEARERFKRGFPSTNLFTDKFGLRTGKNIKKNSSHENIFIFGDSMTFGVGLEYENTYAGLIDKAMKNSNIYNFGVGSYAPSVHLYKLKEAIKNNIIPDKILLFLDLSDVTDEARRWVDDVDGIPKRPEEKPHWAQKKIKDKNNSFLVRNFKLSQEIAALTNYNLRNLRSKIKNTMIQNENNLKIKFSVQGQFTYTKFENLDKSYWNKNDFSKGLKKVNEKISKISKIAKDNNSEFYLIIYPWGETLYKGEKEFSWSNFGKQLCNQNDCILINAIPEFNKYKNINKNWVHELYFINDEHLNGGGAKLLADIVVKKLKK